MPTLAPAGAPGYVPARPVAPTTVATYQLSPYESFTASLTERPDGRKVCALSRIKNTPNGLRRMDTFEFSEHRLLAISSLIDELMRAVAERRAP